MDLMSMITTWATDALGFVLDALRNPSADRQATMLVLAALLLLIIIIVLSVAIAIMSLKARTAERAAFERQASGGTWVDAYQSGEVVPGVENDAWLDESVAYNLVHHTGEGEWRAADDEAHAPSALVSSRPRGQALTTLATLVLVASVVWVALGITTSQKQTCDSCHQAKPHGETTQTDPHRNVDCIACHESGGKVSAATVNLPSRVVHIAAGASKGLAKSYGGSGTTGCRSCHSAILDGTFTDKARGLRVSHSQPLEAGADCLDCHKPKDGVVSAETVGMEPCLRCHDDKTAPAACETCHLSDPATAALGTQPKKMPRPQRLVPDPQCDGCHSTSSCDSCHGIKMPHTREFKGSGHAREAVIELWKDGGKTCNRCHFEGNKPCTTCHEMPFLAHGRDFKEGHKTADWNASCTCHQLRSPIRGRNFCATCHSTKPKGVVESAQGAAQAGAIALPTP